MGTITTALCNTFKQELLQGVHNFSSHTFKLALIKENPTDNYNANTTSYDNGATSLTGGNNDEHANGNGYTTAGSTLAGTTLALDTSNNVAHVTFNNVALTSATIDADGCIIYNDSATNNPAVCVIAFTGGTQSSDNGTFTVAFPSAGHNTSIIRIS
jgi:hypothetical protein